MLISFSELQEICSKYHWIEIEDNEINMYLDHHALSAFRQCEAFFDLSILQRRVSRGGISWPLAFGSVFHSAVEYLYESKAINKFDPQQLTDLAISKWNKANLERFQLHKTYISLGGLQGFLALLMQYVSYYSGDLERLRPIATEVAFGKAKEVPLGDFLVNTIYSEHIKTYKINCYLSGRIDFLMDSGSTIGPMDHKTSAFFKNNPMNTYETQEGMTGYIFATNYIIKKHFPQLLDTRTTDKMWMNFIQIKSEPDSNKRFKRVPLFKTPWQLEQYRIRQISTFRKIFEVFITQERPADWNTNLCNSMFYHECPYRQVHRQGSAESMETILESNYVVIDPWNPEKMAEDANTEEG